MERIVASDTYGSAWMMARLATHLDRQSAGSPDVATLLALLALGAAMAAIVGPRSRLMQTFGRKSLIILLAAAITIDAVAFASPPSGAQ